MSSGAVWNPLKDIGEEWSSAVSTWGQLRVLLFYSYVWLAFFLCTYQSFSPWSLGISCILGEDEEAAEQRDIDAFLIRQAAICKAIVMLGVAKGKATLPNMRVLLAALIWITLFGNLWEGRRILGNNHCSQEYWKTIGIWFGWPLVALLIGHVERHHVADRISSTTSDDNEGGPASSEPLM